MRLRNKPPQNRKLQDRPCAPSTWKNVYDLPPFWACPIRSMVPNILGTRSGVGTIPSAWELRMDRRPLCWATLVKWIVFSLSTIHSTKIVWPCGHGLGSACRRCTFLCFIEKWCRSAHVGWCDSCPDHIILSPSSSNCEIAEDVVRK